MNKLERQWYLVKLCTECVVVQMSVGCWVEMVRNTVLLRIVTDSSASC